MQNKEVDKQKLEYQEKCDIAEQEELINLRAPSTQQVNDPVVGDIREDWDKVRFGIEDLLQRNPHLNFRPEDVYAACVSKDALYWKTDECFVITTIETESFSGNQILFMWIVYSWVHKQDVSSKYIGFFKKAAKGIGISVIETRTNITSLGAKFVKTGWELDHMTYRLKV